MLSWITKPFATNISRKIFSHKLIRRYGVFSRCCRCLIHQANSTPLHAAGGTPVFVLPRLAQKLGLQNLWLKDELRNPTASFKDRASAIVVARAQEIGAEIIVTASTGNAGAALAGMSAAIGQKAIIFAPKSAPQQRWRNCWSLVRRSFL